MSVVLLITRKHGEHFSMHDDDDAAFEALVRYVDEHWADARLPPDAIELDPVMRVDAWIEATHAFFLIGTPSIEIECP